VQFSHYLAAICRLGLPVRVRESVVLTLMKRGQQCSCTGPCIQQWRQPPLKVRSTCFLPWLFPIVLPITGIECLCPRRVVADESQPLNLCAPDVWSLLNEPKHAGEIRSPQLVSEANLRSSGSGKGTKGAQPLRSEAGSLMCAEEPSKILSGDSEGPEPIRPQVCLRAALLPARAIKPHPLASFRMSCVQREGALMRKP
jgi:hypothetical protein